MAAPRLRSHLIALLIYDGALPHYPTPAPGARNPSGTPYDARGRAVPPAVRRAAPPHTKYQNYSIKSVKARRSQTLPPRPIGRTTPRPAPPFQVTPRHQPPRLWRIFFPLFGRFNLGLPLVPVVSATSAPPPLLRVPHLPRGAVHFNLGPKSAGCEQVTARPI